MANAVEDGQVVTATATSSDGSTSEFSACTTVIPASYDWRYTYDALGRLSTACSQWDAVTETCEGDSFSYDYDGAGNLETLSRWDEDAEQVETVQYLYNGANQIRCVDADLSGECDGSETVWQYDAYGNLLDDGTQTYSYDAALRMASVSDGVSTTMYFYNGDGDRIGQVTGDVSTVYILDVAAPLTTVLAEATGPVSSTPAPPEEFIYYLHGLDLVAQSDGTTTEYFAYDGLGSVRQVADETGEALLSQTYDPYGNLYARAGADVTNYGFTGEQEDSSGLLYLRARYYQPGMGRFFQMDPSRQEMNPYQYSYSNPLNYTDPSGLLPELFGVQTVQLGFRDVIEILKKLYRENTQVYGIDTVLRNLETIRDAADRYEIDSAVLAAVLEWESNALERVFINDAVFTSGGETAFLYDLDLWKYIFTGDSSVGIGQVKIFRALYLEQDADVVLRPSPQLWFPIVTVGVSGQIHGVRFTRLDRGHEIAIGMSVSEAIAIEYAAANLRDSQNKIERTSLSLSEETVNRLTIVAYNVGQEEVQSQLYLAADCDEVGDLLDYGYLTNQVGPRYDFWDVLLQ